MSWRTLFIEESEELSLYLDNVKVRRASSDFVFPLSDLLIILIDNYKTIITVKLITACAIRNIPIIVCGDNHHPLCIIHPLSGHYVGSKVLNEQISWTIDQKNTIWMTIIQHKIAKQLFVLKQFDKSQESWALLQNYINSVQDGDSTNREGLAAKVYFRALFGDGFSRREDSALNACLDYGYSVFRAIISKTVVAKGLCPQLGIFHRGAQNDFNLLDDILELFRSVVDGFVYARFRDVKIFVRECRLEILKMLDGKIQFGTQKLSIGNIIEKTIDSLLTYFRKGVIAQELGFEPTIYDI